VIVGTVVSELNHDNRLLGHLEHLDPHGDRRFVTITTDENVADLEGIGLVSGQSGDGTIGLDEEGFRVHTDESEDFL
jgi:hypothetical protein